MRGEIDAEQLHSEMGGGEELNELSQELAASPRPTDTAAYTEREGREPVEMTAIGDVARRAGVSTATVSRVLAGSVARARTRANG